MAPLPVLLDALKGRSGDLDLESASLNQELEEIDRDVAEKRATKTIAAQEAVKELLRRKEGLQKKARQLGAAAGHARLALARLQRAQAAGLQDWRELREERLGLSDFALRQCQDPKAVAGLQAAGKGGTVALEGSKLLFTGSSTALAAVKQAIEALESSFSVVVELEGDMLRLLETRGELKRIADKHGVEISTDARGISISGAVESARKAENAITWQLSGKADLNCPRDLIGATKAQAKELEPETGALIEVVRGGFGGGGIVRIRGNTDCVQEAEEQMRAWLDQREGAYSAFVEAKEAMSKLTPDKVEQLSGDLVHFGRKFGIAATVDTAHVELRGPAGGDWEAPARAELRQILDFYAPAAPEKAKAKAKAKEKPKPKDDDVWGAAPEAEFELGHKW